MLFRPVGVGGGTTRPVIERAVSAIAPTDPERWVDEHGDVLYRYALERVRRPALSSPGDARGVRAPDKFPVCRKHG